MAWILNGTFIAPAQRPWQNLKRHWEVWQEWLDMISVGEEIKSMRNLFWQEEQQYWRCMKLWVMWRKQTRNDSSHLCQGHLVKQTGAVKWTKGSAVAIQNVLRCGAHCQRMLWKSKHKQAASVKFLDPSVAVEHHCLVWSAAQERDLNAVNQKICRRKQALSARPVLRLFPDDFSLLRAGGRTLG